MNEGEAMAKFELTYYVQFGLGTLETALTWCCFPVVVVHHVPRIMVQAAHA